MKDEEVVDETSRCPPSINSLDGANLHDNDGKQSNTGCLILFLLGLPVIDAIGMFTAMAGQYGQVVLMAGLVGFACGAGLGAYLSVKIKRQPWFSSCRWAICGVIGMCLTTGIVSHLVFVWQR
jgi:hypothetical protein